MTGLRNLITLTGWTPVSGDYFILLRGADGGMIWRRSGPCSCR